jgi:hypothetical protein
MPEGTTEAGDESVQLRRIADIVEVRLRKVEEVTTQATQALKQAQEEIIEQCPSCTAREGGHPREI